MNRLAVLGQPIAHSRSPAIHTAAIAALGLSGEWSYEAIEVSPSEFEAFVRSMPDAGFVGANVTIPHKHTALALADERSETAAAIGAANTLTFAEGRIHADNTDAEGFLAALPQSPAGARALVLGAGGAARAIVWALTGEGAEVWIWNRTRSRAEALASEFGAAAIAPGPTASLLEAAGFDLIVNATSVGMDEGGAAEGGDLKALHLDADGLHDRQVVVDMVYGRTDTKLVNAARARGARVVDGLEVLVRQGAASLRIWTGLEPPLDPMRTAARER